MKREGGWLTAAVLTAAVGVGIHAFQSNGAGSVPGGLGEDAAAARPMTTQSAETTAGDEVAADAIAAGPCADLEEQLRSFFAIDKTHSDAPAACYPRRFLRDRKQPAGKRLSGETGGMQFAIAVLPDPLHTHFSLTFDRYAAAIQQGAQDQGFFYNSSWMPWETKDDSYPILTDQQKAQDQKKAQEDQPGIILFRKRSTENQKAYANGLAVFVVGEEATAGIHRTQFRNALDWINLLHGREIAELKIIGPSFRGSLPSLAQLLKDAPFNVGVFSGGVSGQSEADDFVARMQKRQPSGSMVSFLSFQESDDDQIGAYCLYLKDSGISTMERVAIISEDETPFGGTGPVTAKSCLSDDGGAKAGTVNLFYPRDISALRAAYQSQSLFSSGASQSDTDATRKTLKTDLADPEGNQHDTIRSYSGTQTALSQESELQQMVRLLRAHHAEYILLRSSNPLDQIFLTQYLQQEYPEGRIVVTRSDLLLARDMKASGINGIMTLSNYPLLAAEQDWTVRLPSPHAHRAFTNSEAEATYVATRALLMQGKPASGVHFMPEFCAGPAAPDDIPGVRDYAQPFWALGAEIGMCDRPPTWIAVLGRGGFWPVAAISSETVQSHENHALSELRSIFFLRTFRKHYPGSELEARGLAVPISLTVALGLVFLWSLFHLWCCANPTLTQKPGFYAHFARAPYSNARRKSHLALIVVGSAMVGIAPSVIGWGMGAHSTGMEISVNLVPYRLLLMSVWVIGLLSVAVNVWMENRLMECADQAPGQARSFPRPGEVIEFLWPSGIPKRKLFSEIWTTVKGPCLWYFGFTFGFHVVLILMIEPALHEYNRVPTYIRSMNINSGVSPIAPLLILLLGLYCWFWFTLQGQALLGDDRPLLPNSAELKLALPGQTRELELLSMLSREHVAEPIELCGDWISPPVLYVFLFANLIVLTAFLLVEREPVFGHSGHGYIHLLAEWVPLRSLGSVGYSVICFLSFAACAAIILTNTWQLLRMWLPLRHLLATLDWLPLRRTIKALKGFSWGSIWTMGGSVLDARYKLYSRQAESLNHLNQALQDFASKASNPAKPGDVLKAQTGIAEIARVHEARMDFWTWYSQHWNRWQARDTLSVQHWVQEAFSSMAAHLLIEILIPAWQSERASQISEHAGDDEKKSITSDSPPHVLAAEEFVCLVYLGFVQNVLGRARALVSGIIFLFVALAFGVSSYPFDPRPVIDGFIVVLFLVLGFFIFTVYSQMYRDATLSGLTDTTPGELGGEFWMKLVGFGVGPLFGVLASIFPAFSNFFFSWLQPGLSSLK